MIGLRRALLALAIAGFAFGLVLAYVLASSRHAQLRGLEATLALVIGWGFIGAGLYAWWRRPQNNFGPLMTATGFLFFVSEMAASNSPPVYTVRDAVGQPLPRARGPHAAGDAVRSPAVAGGTRARRGDVRVLHAPVAELRVLRRAGGVRLRQCPDNLALITNDPDLARAIDTAINVGAFVIFALTALFLWRHWQEANRAERRALGPVLLTGATVLALLEIGLVAELSGHSTIAEIGYYATQAAILPLPYAFLASLARSRLSRGDAVSELVARLAQASGQEEIHAALVRALGDPSLQLAYWLPEFATYADVDGQAVELAGWERAAGDDADRAQRRAGRRAAPRTLAARGGRVAGSGVERRGDRARERAAERRAACAPGRVEGVACADRRGRRHRAPAARAQPARRSAAATGRRRAAAAPAAEPDPRRAGRRPRSWRRRRATSSPSRSPSCASSRAASIRPCSSTGSARR